MVTMRTDLSTTLTEVQRFLNEFKSDGCQCPACGQKVKTYTRKLNSGMVAFLRGLYSLSKKTPDRFFSLSTILKYIDSGSRSLDYSVLRHWQLIESDKPGKWRITQKGKDFLDGKIAVSRAVVIYNNQPDFFSSDLVKYDKAEKDVFDFKELMDN